MKKSLLYSLVLIFFLCGKLAYAAVASKPQPPPNNPPAVVSIMPSSGTVAVNTPVIFTSVYSDPDGWQNLATGQLLINTSTAGNNCFYAYYDQNANKFYLKDDANKKWLGGYAPGSVYTIANSSAILDCSKSSISGNGTTLSITWSITFKSTFTGTKNLYLYVTDDKGASQGWINKGTCSITQDTTPPTGTIKINNGAQYTNSTSVTLALSAQDNPGGSGLSQMQFSNNNSTWSTPEAYATTKTWTLASGDGTKTVYVKYKDVAGNWSTAVSSTIILDTTLPVTTISGVDGLWHNSSVTVTLSASDTGSGINKTYYSTDGTNPTLVYTAPFTLINDGTYTIKYYSQDKAGNTEVVKTSVNQVKIDKTPPAGTAIINGSPYTSLVSVTLTLNATDAGSGLSQMEFSNDNITYSTPETYATTKTWTLSSGDGTKTVYVKFKDAVGNWSASVSSTIILDTTAPSTTISGVDGLWHNSSVTVTLTASDSGSGINKTYYSTDGSTPTIVYASPFAVSNDGTYTVKYYSIDKAGNAETINIASNQIKIDTTAPSGSVQINNGAQTVNSASVTLTLNAADSGSGLAQMQFSNDNITWSTPEAYATTKTWTLSSGDGTKTVYAKFRDTAGNLSVAYSAQIVLSTDTTPPTGSISINNGATAINTTSVTLFLSAIDTGSGMGVGAQMQFSNDNVTWSTSEAYATTKNWTLVTGEGTKTVYVKFSDVAGNWSTAYSATIILDTTPPQITITSPSDNQVIEVK